MQIKIASYNIMSGGFDEYSYKSTIPERLEILQKSISKIDADFIGLIDTFRWKNLYSKQDLKNLFGYKFVYCVNLNDKSLTGAGKSIGIAVLSNAKITKFETVRLWNRNAVKAQVKFRNCDIDIFVVYLHHAKERYRVRQAQDLLKLVDNDIPTVIMGDLNTIAPEDKEESSQKIDQFLSRNTPFIKKYKPMLDEMEKAKVIKIIKDQGFIDSSKKGINTAPTKLFSPKLKKAFLRIDYMLHSKNLKVKDFKVHSGKLFYKTSDHYPISCSIQI